MEKAKDAIRDFHQKYPHAAREMVWTLQRMGFPLEIQTEEIQGAFGTKPILRKGYYQDSLQYNDNDEGFDQRKGSREDFRSSERREAEFIIDDDDSSQDTSSFDEYSH